MVPIRPWRLLIVMIGLLGALAACTAAGTRGMLARRLCVSVLTTLLVAAGASGLTSPARANGSPVGSVSVGSASGGRMISAPMPRARSHGTRHFRATVLFRRFHHHHDRDAFESGFFPFGFGSSVAQPDLAPTVDQSDDTEGRWPPLWVRLDRYERPTVEKAPSGVTIIRGPGSHHAYIAPAP